MELDRPVPDMGSTIAGASYAYQSVDNGDAPKVGIRGLSRLPGAESTMQVVGSRVLNTRMACEPLSL